MNYDFGKTRTHCPFFDNSFPSGHNAPPPIFLIAGELCSLVHAARNLMQEQGFYHKVFLTNFRLAIFGPDGPGWFQTRVPVDGMQACNQSLVFWRLRFDSIMWHNTRPTKGMRTIRLMNERSFTFSLAYLPGFIGRLCETISSRFATATWEGLCG